MCCQSLYSTHATTTKMSSRSTSRTDHDARRALGRRPGPPPPKVITSTTEDADGSYNWKAHPLTSPQHLPLIATAHHHPQEAEVYQSLYRQVLLSMISLHPLLASSVSGDLPSLEASDHLFPARLRKD